MSGFDESVRQLLGRDVTDDDRRSKVECWQLGKLHWVRDHLPDEHKARYQLIVRERGVPEFADLDVPSRQAIAGFDSPMRIEDLKTLTFPEVVDRLASWKPDEPRFTGLDVRGLGSTFEQYLATNPDEFSRLAEVMVGCPPIFVRTYISKMGEAVKEGRAIDVSAVLHLCKWVVDQPPDQGAVPAVQPEGLVDRNWRWSRDEVSRFVQRVCEASSDGKPRYPLDDLRESLWLVLDPVTRGPAESCIVEDIEKWDPRVHDYLDLGINSPRGQAVDAVLAYARWIANHRQQERDGEGIVAGGFDSMPEVRTVLDWQITPENACFEVMSVIGAHIGLLYWIDKEWLAANADRIFHLKRFEEEPARAYGWAAWNAFLVWSRPHIEFYRLLRSQFAYAVEQASSVSLAEPSREQPMLHLGEHLVVLYGRGQLGLDDDDHLLRRFFSTARPEIRRHSVGFAGRTLEGDKEIPVEAVKRFIDLWDWYWPTSGRNDAQEKVHDSLFGLWFACGKFPAQWSLDRLEEFIDVVPAPEPEHAIAEQLATVAQTDILKAVRILDSVIRTDREGWRIHGWLESAKEVLRLALRAGGDASRKAALLIDYLGRRGYIEYGTLLQEGLPGSASPRDT